MKLVEIPLLGLLSALLLGCVWEESLRTSSSVSDPGLPVSSYSVPRASPRGRVYVVSLGIERLQVPAASPDQFLRIRIAVENQSDPAVWLVSATDQRLEVGGLTVAPAFASGSGGGDELALRAGDRAYLDVYFPIVLAADRTVLTWRLSCGVELVVGTTELVRTTVPDSTRVYFQPPTSPNVLIGFGPSFWIWPDYYSSSWGGYWGSGYGYWGGYWSPYYRYGPPYPPERHHPPPPGADDWRGGGGSPPPSSGGGSNGGSSNGGGGWRGRRR